MMEDWPHFFQRIPRAIMKLTSLVPMLLATYSQSLQPNYTSPAGVEIYNPSALFPPTGPWSLMSKADNTVYIAGMELRAPAFVPG